MLLNAATIFLYTPLINIIITMCVLHCTPLYVIDQHIAPFTGFCKGYSLKPNSGQQKYHWLSFFICIQHDLQRYTFRFSNLFNLTLNIPDPYLRPNSLIINFLVLAYIWEETDGFLDCFQWKNNKISLTRENN